MDLVNHIKSWSYAIYSKALLKTRTEAGKQQILQRYYQELEKIMSKNPLHYVLDFLYYIVVITKE